MFTAEKKDRETHTEVYIYYNGELIHKRWLEKGQSVTFSKYGGTHESMPS